MQARFYIDPTTGAPHIHNHRVDEDEVVEVLEHPAEDRAGRAGSRIALGQTPSGRYLSVIYVPDDDPESVFVITAYDLPGSLWRRTTGAEEGNINDPEQVSRRMGRGKVQQVLAKYEQQTEDEALAEDEAGVAPSETVMNVPRGLVPKVRELIAKHRS